MQLPSLARLDLRREAAVPTSTGGNEPTTDSLNALIAKVLVEVQSETDASDRLMALRALVKMVDVLDDSLLKTPVATAIREAGCYPILVQLVQTGTDDEKSVALNLFRSMREKNDHYNDVLTSGAIDAIAQILRTGTVEQKTTAVSSLRFSFGGYKSPPTIQRAIWEAGGLHACLALVQTGNVEQTLDCMDFLGVVAKHWDKLYSTVIRNAGGFPKLLAVFQNGTKEQQAKAAETLCALEVAEKTGTLRDAGGIQAFVDRLRTDGFMTKFLYKLLHHHNYYDGSSGPEFKDWSGQNARAMIEAGFVPIALSMVPEFAHPVAFTPTFTEDESRRYWRYQDSRSAIDLLTTLSVYEKAAMEALMEVLGTHIKKLQEWVVYLVSEMVYRSSLRPTTWWESYELQALRDAGVVQVLVELLRRDLSEENQESVLKSLIMIVNNDGASAEALCETGGLAMFYSHLISMASADDGHNRDDRDYSFNNAPKKEKARRLRDALYNHSLKFRLLIDADRSSRSGPDVTDCMYWLEVLPKFDEVRNAIQAHGELYDHLVRIAPYLKERCEALSEEPTEGASARARRERREPPGWQLRDAMKATRTSKLVVSPKTLDRMLHNFRLLGAAATAESNPSTDAATTLLKALIIEVDEAMRSPVWNNAHELLGKTQALVKAGAILVAAGAVTITPLLATKLAWDLGITTFTWFPTLLYSDNILYAQRKLLKTLKREWHEEMDTPEFRAMEEGPVEAYTRGDLEADMRALGLNEEQLMQAQRFEHWMAIAGTIAERFGAAAERGNPAAKHVLELVEALQARLLAPPGEGHTPSILYEISAREFAANKRTLNEMLAAEQAIENEEAAPAEQQAKRRRTAAPIAASLAAFFGPETVVRLRLRAEDLHPLLAARHGDA